MESNESVLDLDYKSSESRNIPHWHNPENESIPIIEGSGATVTDANGDSFLDFVASLYCVNAGHDNKRIIEAITKQLERIPYVSSGKENDARAELASELAAVAPEPLTDVLFSVSGSEANELAIQFARESQDAPKVLTRWQSYHGSTYGAATLTGDPSTRNTVEAHAATTGSGKFLPPLPEVFDAEGSELAEKAANHLEFVVKNEGPDSIAAIMMEPVAGSSGGYPTPSGYFERVREICDKYNILLIADEVITGFGRCGKMFAMQTESVDPDMITFAKGVTGSYIPLGGVLMREELGDRIRDGGTLTGQTFAGHPVACAAGIAAIQEYQNELIENVQSLAPVLQDELTALKEKHDVITDVRGRGFLWGIVVKDPESSEPFANSWVDADSENPVADVAEEAKKNGLLVGVGRPDYQLLISPPLCIEEADIANAIEALDEAFINVFE
ncbi:aminotransferase family protein [Natronorubrum aibiense]|uniref:Aminotransferase class III-fold pyridoxal phosphate-dependent enzyme n=1 Tax=Natronorubrum aibiense TaxID=348826 RepID=A0A5P9P8R0_9EURY|nr:aminotransferase class III-fold pyridoxal phosphate-dependent enzyme [Natronorubrum aibiense]QFU84529.1 aminotransferase class III-fold pyridoxal phosphate-dependent enzyme [Natronorubrum aibiense]